MLAMRCRSTSLEYQTRKERTQTIKASTRANPVININKVRKENLRRETRRSTLMRYPTLETTNRVLANAVLNRVLAMKIPRILGHFLDPS